MARGRKKLVVNEEPFPEKIEDNSFNFRIILDFKVVNEEAANVVNNGMIVKYVDLVAKALSTKNIEFIKRYLMTSPLPFFDPNLEIEEHKFRFN